jgi:hypothetical protein
MMVWQKKGLCGCDIKMQTYFIAGMFLVSNFTHELIVMGGRKNCTDY